jgi:hypothetical protein
VQRILKYHLLLQVLIHTYYCCCVINADTSKVFISIYPCSFLAFTINQSVLVFPLEPFQFRKYCCQNWNTYVCVHYKDGAFILLLVL